MAKLLKEWLADDAIDGQVLSNNDFVQGRNAADNANIDMLKINVSDKIEVGADLQMGSFNILTSGTVDGVDVSAKSTNVTNLVTLSGVAADSTSLGSFSGSIVPDSQNIKQAIQALETYSESTQSTASTGLTKVGVDIRIADASAANGISITSGAVSAVLNASHLEISSNAISIKSNAIGETELNNVDGGVDADSLVLSSGYLAAAGTPTIGDTIEAALEKIVGNATADYNLGSDSFSGNGSTTDFVTTNNLKSASGMWVTIDGVMRVITTDYTVNVGINTISFLTAPALGQSINIKYFK